MVRKDLIFTEEQRKSIVDTLFQIGCCPKCVLRFMMEYSDLRIYRSSKAASEHIAESWQIIDATSDVKTEIDEDQNAAKRRKNSRCVACLGILSELCEASEIISKVKQGGYELLDNETFVLQVSVPVCLELRQLSVFQNLQSKFPEIYAKLVPTDVPSVKEALKWALGPLLESAAGIKFDAASAFEISVVVAYPDDQFECNSLLALRKADKSIRSNGAWNRNQLAKVLDSNSKQLENYFPYPPRDPTEACCFEQITCRHEPIYFAGRYNKYSRTLPQTPWLLNGVRMMESSVQELICEQINPLLKCDDIVFSSSGREDVDVRTLGKGRPFVLQLVNPHRCRFTTEDMKRFQQMINSNTKDVFVRDLQVIVKDDLKQLKEGEEEKIKAYRALCYSGSPITPALLETLNGVTDLTLQQKTPVRVLHRRPIAVREKIIHQMSVEPIDDHHFNVRLRTQAGTYVKEFVHGDFGRTTPNLCTLLNTEVDILDLDVEEVELDWPPPLNNESD